jgi:UDP-N-acetyl-D-mannosaminuronic acid dehydrogenase
MKVCVVGLGYIGLPTASLLATKGFQVLGVDVKREIVDTINRGEIHIFEPDLDLLVKSAVNSERLRASLQAEPADVFIVSVPTPFRDGHVPDLSYVEAATKTIAPHVAKGSIVVLESTSPVGTTEEMARWISEARPDLGMKATLGANGVTTWSGPVHFAHCPERVLPGHILKELVDNDRIVGGINEESTEAAAKFYGKFVNGNVLQTDSRTAELAKLVENSYRDVNIAFANELSFICDKLGINVWRLIELANRHPRVKILQPGPGVGGHCIAVDPWFIVHSVPRESRLIRTAREVNDSKPHYVVQRIRDKAERFKMPVIACLGLSYKPDIDDLRESPAVDIVKELGEANIGRVVVAEPHVQDLPRELAGKKNISLVDFRTAIAEADIVVMLVNHKQFQAIDRSLLREKVVIDTRGVWQ